MPELPEVETIKRGLRNKVIGKKITDVEVMQKKSIRNSRAEFVKKLKSKSIEKIERKGKFLAIKLKSKPDCRQASELYLIIHLGMTGQLIYGKNDNFKNKHTRAAFILSDNSKIIFNDIRRFGYLKAAGLREKEEIFNRLGTDPTSRNFTFKKLSSMLKNRKVMLKSALLNQKLLAGIGNIYADEICFRANIKPNRKTRTLSSEEIKRLYNSIKRILKLAIKHRGTTFSNYVDIQGKKGNFASFLKVYQRENQICLKCKKSVIKKIKIAGRSTRYCDKCQK